jgi:nitric oxide reductase activation protein
VHQQQEQRHADQRRQRADRQLARRYDGAREQVSDHEQRAARERDSLLENRAEKARAWLSEFALPGVDPDQGP